MVFYWLFYFFKDNELVVLGCVVMVFRLLKLVNVLESVCMEKCR